MKKSYLILAAVATMIASCSKSDLVIELPEEENETVKIGFDAFADKATKAAVDDGTDLTSDNGGFGVWGYKASTAALVTADGTSGNYAIATTGTTITHTTVFNNVKVWYEDDETLTQGYTYDVPKYWDKNMYYAFFAYAPYDASNASIDTYGKITIANIPAIQNVCKEAGTVETYVQYTGSDESNVKDYLIASSVGNQKYAGTNQSSATYDGKDKTVGFTFGHILSKFNVNLKMKTQYEDPASATDSKAKTYRGVKSLRVTKLNITNMPTFNTVPTTQFAQSKANAVAGVYTVKNYTTQLDIIAGTNSTVSSSDDIYLLVDGSKNADGTVNANPAEINHDFHYYVAPNDPANAASAENKAYVLNIDYEIEYVDGTVEVVTRSINLTVPVGTTTTNPDVALAKFEQNYVYTLNILVDLAQIYFTVDAVTDWQDPAESTVTVE